MPVITTKRRRGANGSCARWQAAQPASNHVRIGGERRLAEWVVDWLPATRNQRRCASAMRAHVQLQLDCMADHGRPSSGAALWAFDQRIRMGCADQIPRASRKIWQSPIRASGKCAARRSTSPIPRSWRGLRSTAPSRVRNRSALMGRSNIGANSRRDLRRRCVARI